MSQWTPRLTADQRDRILYAHLAEGINQSEVARRAKRGELGVPAFDVSRSTVGHLIREHGDRFRMLLLKDATRADSVIEEAEAVAVHALERKVRRIEKLRRDGKEPSLEDIRQLGNAVQAIKRMRLQDRRPQVRPGQKTPHNATPTQPGSVLDRLGVSSNGKPKTKNGSRAGSFARSDLGDAAAPTHGAASAA